MAQKTIVVFSSHVARGSVGLRASALALETLGNCVWSVPTTILAHHPGHGTPARVSMDDQEFADLVFGLSRPEWLGQVDAVLCGYFSSPAQIEVVRKFYEKLRDQDSNKSPLLIVDPVIGDNGRLYVPNEIAESINRKLLPLANIITPNRFELQWLADTQELRSNEDILTALSALKARSEQETVLSLVTSAFSLMPGSTGSLLQAGTRIQIAEHSHIQNAPNGLGDLTAAVFTHHILAGAKPAQALERTTASVADILEFTVRGGKDELAIDANLTSLHRPRSSVQLRQLVEKRTKKTTL